MEEFFEIMMNQIAARASENELVDMVQEAIDQYRLTPSPDTFVQVSFKSTLLIRKMAINQSGGLEQFEKALAEMTQFKEAFTHYQNKS